MGPLPETKTRDVVFGAIISVVIIIAVWEFLGWLWPIAKAFIHQITA